MRYEELIAHGAFIRSLARRLVPDEYLAADVAQQTFVAALEHPPTDEKPLGAWLATVTRNFARKLYRRESIRETKERYSAAQKPAPSPATVVEREEIRRKVVAAVLELQDPYRSTLLLRFYEELSTRQVARRMDLPLETVRTRIKRGLHQLRLQLDHLYEGDRKQWCLALAPLALLKPGAAVAGLSFLSAAMQSTMIKLAAVVLFIAGLSLTASWLWPENESLDPAVFKDMVAAPALETSNEKPPTTELSKASNRGTLPERSVEKVAVVPDMNRILEGVVVQYDSKRPLADLMIKIYKASHHNEQPTEFIQTVTDTDGRFRINGVPWLVCNILLEDENYHCTYNKRVSFESTDHPDPLVLTAAPGTFVKIKVLGKEGKPEPHALLSIGKIFPSGSRSHSYPFVCDDQGFYFLNQGVSVGTEIAVLARGPESHGLSEMAFIQPRVGGTNEVILRLTGAPPIHGRVLDPEDQPLTGVQVRPLMICPKDSCFETLPIPELNAPWVEDIRNDAVLTDADGYFHVEGLIPGSYRFSVMPEEFEKTAVDIRITGKGSHIPDKIILRPKRATLVRGRAVNEEGNPVNGAVVFFYHTDASRQKPDKYSIHCDTEDGSFTFPSHRIYTEVFLSAADRLDFVVSAPGYLPFVKRAARPGEKEIRVVLQKGAGVSGQVFSAIQEKPLPHFRILRDSKDWELEPDAISFNYHFKDPWKQSFQDPKGLFSYQGLEPGPCTLTFAADGYTSARVDLTLPDTGASLEGLKVVLHPCLFLEGQVLWADTQKPFINASVAAYLHVEPSDISAAVDLMKTSKTVQTDAFGHFWLAGLEPGRYQLKIFKDRSERESWRFGPYDLQPGKNQSPLTLEVDADTGQIVVQVLDRNNRPVPAGAHVSCSTSDLKNGSNPANRKTDDQGIARLEGVRPGQYMVYVHVEDDQQSWQAKKPVEVFRDRENHLTLVQPGSGFGALVQGRVLKRGRPCPGIKVHFSATMTQSRSEHVVTDANGAYLFPNVKPGSYDLHGPDRKGVFLEVNPGDSMINKEITLASNRIAGGIQMKDYGSLSDMIYLNLNCYDESDLKSPNYPCRSSNGLRDGRFSFDYLDEGCYAICAYLRLQEGYYSGLLRNVEAWDDRLERSITIQMEKSGEIGVTLLASRYPTRRDVRLFHLLDSGLEIERHDLTILPREGNNRSRWFHGLLPGAYRIDFREPTGSVSSTYVDIEAGETREIEAPSS